MNFSKPAALLMIFFAVPAFADIPNTLNFQGRLMDQVGQPVTNGQYAVTFRLYTAASGGNMVWEEGQTVAASNGYFNTVLGNTVALTAPMFSQPLWVGIQVGNNAEMTPRQKLSTAAYAMNVPDGAITKEKINYPTLLTTLNQAGYKFQFGTAEKTTAVGSSEFLLPLPSPWSTEHAMFIAGFSPASYYSATVRACYPSGADKGLLCVNDTAVQNVHIWWISIGK